MCVTIIVSSLVNGFSIVSNNNNKKNAVIKQSKPFEQRLEGPRRGARRMNHKFQHLYRHIHHNYTSVRDYLVEYAHYTPNQVTDMMQEFPYLRELSLSIIHGNYLFLRHTLNATQEQLVQIVPPQFYGSRMETSIAPKHAFLQFYNHSTIDLLSSKETFQHFMSSCRNDKAFCSSTLLFNNNNNNHNNNNNNRLEQLQELTTAFHRGIMAATRNEHNYTFIQNDDLIRLLIRHGANPYETDIRGATLLHWAAGAGNIPAYQALLPYFTTGNPSASRDGATPLHWAVAGVQAQNIGSGGSLTMCQFIVEYCQFRKKVLNACTKDDNSVLMWAAWSGSLDICKYLIRHKVSVDGQNRNGCTVAHWAASGGNLQLCQYLHTYTDTDFFQPNHAGNTPLSHAVAYQHTDIVQWLLELSQKENNENDIREAGNLAWDFVQWQQQQNDDDSSSNHDNSQDIFDLFDTTTTATTTTQMMKKNEEGEESDWYLTTST